MFPRLFWSLLYSVQSLGVGQRKLPWSFICVSFFSCIFPFKRYVTQSSVPSLVFPPWATRINANWNGLKLLSQSSHWLQRCLFVLLTLATSNATEIIHLKIEGKLHGFLSMCGHLPKLFSNHNRRGRVWKVQSTNCHSMPSCHLKRTRLSSTMLRSSIYLCMWHYLIPVFNNSLEPKSHKKPSSSIFCFQLTLRRPCWCP